MTRDEYDQRRQRLDEELRAGIELLQTAHRHQVRALDLVWMTDGESAPGERDSPPPPPEARPAAPPAPLQLSPAQAPRRKAGELYEDVLRTLPNVPEVFDAKQVRLQLGYDVDRGSLHRALLEMVGLGILSLHSYGEGRKPTKYRKNAAESGGTEA